MHGNIEAHLAMVATGLGMYYILLCAMNWIAALLMWRDGPRTYFRLNLPIVGRVRVTNMGVWFVVGCLFLLLSPLAMSGQPFPEWHFTPFASWMPQAWERVKGWVNWASGPVFLSFGSLGLMVLWYFGRRVVASRTFGWSLLNVAAFAMGVSMTDPNFFAIAAKPDNVPIVGLVFLLGYFTWLSTRLAVLNDDRRRQGLPPLEKLDDEKVLVWPDLVYTELICMVALTAVLLVWALALPAPLEEPASAVKTPNPSKAPWYFLGLQEMLVYFDPWYAGVVLPSIVIFGLMAIPFLDFNRAGNGYYTIEERKFSYIVFQFGFMELWVVLIILGTFLRGPNWNFFGPFEYWDAHKVLVQNNIDLSQLFWGGLLGMALPKAPQGSSGLTEFGYILLRESPGILLLLGYFLLLPPIMATTVFRKFYIKMGFIRYMVMANLLLLMFTLPIKMILRWTINLKYLVSIPEYFLNF